VTDRHNRDIERVSAPLPEPLEETTIDSHCHMELIAKANADDPAVGMILDQAKSVGIDRLVQIGYDLEQSKWSVACANAWPGKVLAAVALHPNEAPVVENLEEQLTQIEKLAADPRVRGVGETGLDFFRTEPALRAKQEASFRAHIEIAKRKNKALIIHDRDSHSDVLRVLREVGAPEKTIFHCFSGDRQMAEECIAAGYFLSFAGTVTFKNAPELREALKITPLSKMLVETDAPFLAPMPHRGSLNLPSQIPNTLRFMADVVGRNVNDLAIATRENALTIFGSFD